MGVADTPAWKALTAQAASARTARIADLFTAEPDRLERMCVEAAGLFIDFSKQTIDKAVFDQLVALGEERGVAAARDDMFAGAIVNATENRAALHVALRGSGANDDAKAFSAQTRERMRTFAGAVRTREHTGATGRPLRSIVHIGIGGSGLGPALAWEVLAASRDPAFDVRFAANIDPAEINDALQGLDPETTLVVIVSKSFTTQETRLNADVARHWLNETLGEEGARRHLIAVTAAPERAADYGVEADAVFAFRDWVGGRFSVWSAVGLSLEIGLNAGAFDAFLDGAAAMDRHFSDAPLERNGPVLMALTEVWNRNFLGRGARAVVAYAKRLAKLAPYLQQLEMESNGKGVDISGAPVETATAPVVFGAPGADAQHAFFQQLHQGPDITPVDFIGVLEDGEARPELRRALVANLLAQPEALMTGDPEGEGYRAFPGDRPSTMILMDRLSPEALGALLALYEHKVFVESVIWGINAFDQWGVELGKTLAKDIFAELEGGAARPHDASTTALIARARKRLG